MTEIWFRDPTNDEKTGPFSLEVVTGWYEKQQILPFSELSADGKIWLSIESLRRRNGPAFPFSSFDTGPRVNIVQIARKNVSTAREKVERLEKQTELVLKKVEDEEKVLDKLKEMEIILQGKTLAAEMNSEKSEEEKRQRKEKRLRMRAELERNQTWIESNRAKKKLVKENEERFKKTNEFIVETESPQEEVEIYHAQQLSRDEIFKISSDITSTLKSKLFETRQIFRPRFFCAKAFRLVSRVEASSPLHKMKRVCVPPNNEPIPLVGPLAILDRCDDRSKQAKDITRESFNRLKALLPFCNFCAMVPECVEIVQKIAINFDEFDHTWPVNCNLCGDLCTGRIDSISSLLRHVLSRPHLIQIVRLGTSVDEYAYAFWSNLMVKYYRPKTKVKAKSDIGDQNEVLDEAYLAIKSLIVETEKPRVELEAIAAALLDRSEVLRLGAQLQSLLESQNAEIRDLFRPRFFCAKAFRLVAKEESSPLHRMKRVCNKEENSAVDFASVDGPLSILQRCDDPSKQLACCPKTALQRFQHILFKYCNQERLGRSCRRVNAQLKENYDDFDHPLPVVCSLCNNYEIYSAWLLLKHIITGPHIAAVEVLGTGIHEGAYWYWHWKIYSNFVYPPLFSEANHPPTRLQGLTKKLTANEVIASSRMSLPESDSEDELPPLEDVPLPLTVLHNARNVEDPCGNLEEFLRRLGGRFTRDAQAHEKIAAVHSTLNLLFTIPVYCIICKYPVMLKSSGDFIAHITSDMHIEKARLEHFCYYACKSGGTASVEALEMWMVLVEKANL